MARTNPRKVKHGLKPGDWIAKLERSKDVSDEHDRVMCVKAIDDVVSRNQFGDIMLPRAEQQKRWWIDEVKVNWHKRYHGRLRSSIGDTRPEVRWNRATPGIETIGEIVDRASMREAGRMGLPELFADGSGPICTKGSAIIWIDFPDHPDAQEVVEGSKGADEQVLAIGRGESEGPSTPDADLAGALHQGSLQAKPGDLPRADGPQANLSVGAAKQQEQVEDEKKNPIYWRSENGRAEADLLPFGDWFLWDCDVIRWKHKRWVARKHHMPIDEAKIHPAFTPSARQKIQRSVETEASTKGFKAFSTAHDTPFRASAASAAKAGFFEYWELVDRKHLEHYYVAHGIDEYLEVDSTFHMQTDGKPWIRAIGDHPGTFPVIPVVPIKPPRRDEFMELGWPACLPGHSVQMAYVRHESYVFWASKRILSAQSQASGKWLDDELSELTQNIPGAVHRTRDPNAKIEPIKGGDLKPDMVRLTGAKLEAQYAMSQEFPLAQLTSAPQAETARQEEIGVASGNVSMGEILRQSEVGYSHAMHVLASIMRRGYRPEAFDDILGHEEAVILRALWGRLTAEEQELAQKQKLPEDAMKAIGVPWIHELPRSTFASGPRDPDFVRIKAFMDLHDRAKQEIDEQGFPKLETIHLLREGAKMLGAGTLPDKEVPQEIRVARELANQLMALFEKSSGVDMQTLVQTLMEPMKGGKPSSNGSAPRAPDRDTGQRRDEAGRQEAPPNLSTLITASRDAGPGRNPG